MGSARKAEMPVLRALLVFAVVMSLLPSTTEGGRIFREDPNTLDGGNDGISVQGRSKGSKGYTRPETEFKVPLGSAKELKVDFRSAAKGAFSFDLQRVPGASPDNQRTVFTLSGPESRSPFFAQVRWSSDIDPTRPILYLRGARFKEAGICLWAPEVLLDRPVREGEWIQIDIVWDDDK